MKITVWIRAAAANPREITMRVDSKCESFDTPYVRNLGDKLVKAIESGGERIE